MYKDALGDKYPAVRFAAAMAIGDVRYENARDVLVGMAQTKNKDARAEPDKRVFCAVIYALHRLGDRRFTGQLGELVSDDEKEVRANVAMILGKLGEKSATIPLEARQGVETDPTVQLQLVEALAALGEPRYVNLLEAYTKGQWLEDRLVAISAMERVGSERAPQVLREMVASRQPPRVRVAAAGALAGLGVVEDSGYRLCIRAIRSPVSMLREQSGASKVISDVETASLRGLGALSVGKMKRTEAVKALHPLLSTQDGGVRVAAAMSILRLLESYRPAPVSPPIAPKPQPASQTAAPEKKLKKLPELHTAGGKD